VAVEFRSHLENKYASRRSRTCGPTRTNPKERVCLGFGIWGLGLGIPNNQYRWLPGYPLVAFAEREIRQWGAEKLSTVTQLDAPAHRQIHRLQLQLQLPHQLQLQVQLTLGHK